MLSVSYSRHTAPLPRGCPPADSAGVPRSSLILVVLTALATGCASTGALTGPAAFPGAPVPAGISRSTTPAPIVLDVLQTALSFVGTPYRFGGDDPASGFDCSGLVRYALALHQVDVPRTVEEQFGLGRPVSRDEIQTGDLVFFSTIGPGATHVGIVVESDAQATFVHAPATGGVVRVERFDAAYWQSRFVGARRLF